MLIICDHKLVISNYHSMILLSEIKVLKLDEVGLTSNKHISSPKSSINFWFHNNNGRNSLLKLFISYSHSMSSCNPCFASHLYRRNCPIIF